VPNSPPLPLGLEHRSLSTGRCFGLGNGSSEPAAAWGGGGGLWRAGWWGSGRVGDQPTT
jgi:hypothetical protein